MLGRKIEDKQERAVLLAYMECIDKQAPRFIVEDMTAPSELVAALHLLLTDVWPTDDYSIARIVRSGVFFQFASRREPKLETIIGEWIGNRCHGVIYVDAIYQLRKAGLPISQ